MPRSGSVLLLLSLPREVPLDCAADALVEVHLRRKAQLARRDRLVGTGERHVAHLVGQLVDDGLLAHVLLDRADELVQGVRGAAAQVHHKPRVDLVDGRDHAAHDVVDEGELPHGGAVAVLVDGLVVVDGVDELEGGHVGPPTWPVDSEEAEHCDVELVEVVEGVPEQLATALRRGIRADRGVTSLVLTEWRARVLPVDAAARGGHDVLHPEVPAVLEDVDRADDVRRDVAVEVLDGVAHSRLGCQMAHGIGLLILEYLREGVLVTDV
mmetsp:Transcript_12628/g.25691  ORF Transcript_12628/g.25691 Transcript_12628/m.25691 type:complete len:268 (+) Transcript_12628:507-1310(+)